MPKHDEHVIRVTVDKGSVSVEPDGVYADHTDRIRWESTNGAGFRIEFKDDSCFDEVRLSFEQAKTARQPSKTAMKGKAYHYTVIDEEDDKNVKDPYIKIKSPTIEDP